MYLYRSTAPLLCHCLGWWRRHILQPYRVSFSPYWLGDFLKGQTPAAKWGSGGWAFPGSAQLVHQNLKISFLPLRERRYGRLGSRDGFGLGDSRVLLLGAMEAAFGLRHPVLEQLPQRLVFGCFRSRSFPVSLRLFYGLPVGRDKLISSSLKPWKRTLSTLNHCLGASRHLSAA